MASEPTRMAPGAAREGQEHAAEENDHDRGDRAHPDLFDEDLPHEIDERQDHECAEHVRVLEGAGGAIEAGQALAEPANVEIAHDARDRGGDGRKDIAAAQGIEPSLRIDAQQHREEQGGDAEIGGDEGERHRRRLVQIGHQADEPADAEQDEAEAERNDRGVHSQAAADEEEAEHEREHELVGRRLDEGDEARGCQQEEQSALDATFGQNEAGSRALGGVEARGAGQRRGRHRVKL